MNQEIVIRNVEIEDSYDLIELKKKIDSESSFMLRREGERKTTFEEEMRFIEGVLSRKNKMIFVACDGDKLIGYLRCMGGDFDMSKHTAAIVVGILKEYNNQGIGTRLFENMQEWAQTVDIHRLELRVNVENDIAVHLYKKIGFEIDGIAKESIFLDGEFKDMYMMSKILNK